MKRTLIVAVMSAFAVALIANCHLPVGRSLGAAESANVWGRGYLCHNGDPMCSVTFTCDNYFPCELGAEQQKLLGPNYECIWWPFNDKECNLATQVACLLNASCKLNEDDECILDPNSIPFVEMHSYAQCVLTDPPPPMEDDPFLP